MKTNVFGGTGKTHLFAVAVVACVDFSVFTYPHKTAKERANAHIQKLKRTYRGRGFRKIKS